MPNEAVEKISSAQRAVNQMEYQVKVLLMADPTIHVPQYKAMKQWCDPQVQPHRHQGGADGDIQRHDTGLH
jgi:hypothetical protein